MPTIDGMFEHAHDRPRRQRVAPAKDRNCRLWLRRLAVMIPPAPFRHRNLGNLAPIGRKEAVFDHGWIKVRARVGSASQRWLPQPRTSAAAAGHEIYA
jgi:hypothetical protein